MFCSELFEGMKEESKHAIIENVEKGLKPSLCENGVWFANYKRIRVIEVKG